MPPARWDKIKKKSKNIWENGEVPGEPEKKKWPRVFDGVAVTSTVKVKLSDLFYLRDEAHPER
jgi:hypothetical protein